MIWGLVPYRRRARTYESHVVPPSSHRSRSTKKPAMPPGRLYENDIRRKTRRPQSPSTGGFFRWKTAHASQQVPGAWPQSGSPLACLSSMVFRIGKEQRRPGSSLVSMVRRVRSARCYCNVMDWAIVRKIRKVSSESRQWPAGERSRGTFQSLS